MPCPFLVSGHYFKIQNSVSVNYFVLSTISGQKLLGTCPQKLHYLDQEKMATC